MSEPPEPNPDGSYHLSPDQITDLRSYFEALKQPDIPHETRLQYITEALSKLPTPQQIEQAQKKYDEHIELQIREHQDRYHPPKPEKSPDLIDLENGLNERYDRELKAINLAEAHDCSAAKRHHEMIIQDKLSQLSNPTPAQQKAIIEQQFSLLDAHRKQIIETSLAKKEQLKEQLQNASSPELIALEKALKERYEKERENLTRAHRAELKPVLSDGHTYREIADRQAKEMEKLEATYRNDLKRHIQEAKESQKRIKELEERNRSLKPDDPKQKL